MIEFLAQTAGDRLPHTWQEVAMLAVILAFFGFLVWCVTRD